MLSKSTINEVKELPIVDVISKYTTIKQHGSSYTGCCPFHNESTPSFSVAPKRGIYKCFGCGKAGNNGITFLMDLKKLSYPEAIRELAKEFNVPIEETKASPEDEIQRQRNDDYSTVTRGATGHYVQELHKRPDLIQQIMAERDISRDTLLDFQIGYAPDEWKFLTTPIIEKGFFKPAEALGLIKRSEKDTNYDFFRNRIMIPIVRKDGTTIGFAGRRMDDSVKENPKWLNSPECEGFFIKGNTLYGLNVTYGAIRELREAYIVEGYWDVIGPYDRGIENIVATMGTAFTDGQAQLLRKYCDTAVIWRDGDKAGRESTPKAIEQCMENDLYPFVLSLPDGEDPGSWIRYFDWLAWDTYNDRPNPDPAVSGAGLQEWCEHTRKDGVKWYIDHKLEEAGEAVSKRSEATELICQLISKVPNEFARMEYVNHAVKEHKLTKKTIDSRIKNIREELREEKEVRVGPDDMPKWVNVDSLYTDGFVMNYEKDKAQIGIYFKGDTKAVSRLTNYVVKPLYLVVDNSFPRRMIEVYNGRINSMVELPAKAFISQDAFESEIVAKGAYYTEPSFGKNHYKRLANWLMDNMHMVYELRTLGWQQEGFFAFSNLCVHGPEILRFDEYGVVTVGDKSFLSSGVSKLNKDARQEDNVYENDLYLKYVKSPITFEEWAQLFFEVYDEHAPFGIAFVFISAFKDIVTRIAKCPYLYFYGPKGSGKSAIAESIMWFFFSGKNAEGKLIQGYNLAIGQGTPFSFWSRLQRFRNVPMLANEYDPSNCEPWKKGAIKSHYDNEGREVGAADTGKKRKTEVQKPQGTLMLAGQYLDMTDDMAIPSRSITCAFSLEKNKNRSNEQKLKWAKLNDLESHGISSLAADLYQYREFVASHLKDEYWKVQNDLNIELRRGGRQVEIRLVSNYAINMAIINIMARQVKLPFTPEEFRIKCLDRIKAQAAILKENNVLNSFWTTVENLFDSDILHHNLHFKVSSIDKVLLTREGGKDYENFGMPKDIIFLRLGLIYDHYAKRYRELYNKVAPSKDTIETYLKDQTYYLGNCPGTWFKDKNTSAFALDYTGLDIKLVKDGGTDHTARVEEPAKADQDAQAPADSDEELPF